MGVSVRLNISVPIHFPGAPGRRLLDLTLLQEALSKEAADEAAEMAYRERRREEVRQYREQLALMMEKEREDSAERDALILKAQLEQVGRGAGGWEQGVGWCAGCGRQGTGIRQAWPPTASCCCGFAWMFARGAACRALQAHCGPDGVVHGGGY